MTYIAPAPGIRVIDRTSNRHGVVTMRLNTTWVLVQWDGNPLSESVAIRTIRIAPKSAQTALGSDSLR